MQKPLSTTYKRVEDQAKIIDETRAQIRTTTSKGILIIGQQLIEGQSRLAKYGEGTFIKWCKERLNIKKTTAYKWIVVADRFSDCSHCELIARQALYMLSDPTIPNQARLQAKEIAEQGGTVTVKRAAALIEAARPPKTAEEAKADPKTVNDLKIAWTAFCKIWKSAKDSEKRRFNRWRDDKHRWMPTVAPGGVNFGEPTPLTDEDLGLPKLLKPAEFKLVREEGVTHLYRPVLVRRAVRAK